ncbi:MAG: hypothetical protein M3Q11_04585 [Pseudomonadota bacterium]|nr:hypothetical protein [Pseudomonadota bacterium]
MHEPAAAGVAAESPEIASAAGAPRGAILVPCSEQLRGRLMEIADRCPVYRTLRGSVRIVAGAG